MQNLEHLTIESCRGAYYLTLPWLSDTVAVDVNTVVCSLSGPLEACEDSASCAAEHRRLVCPRLQHPSLSDCSNVALKCLRHTIRARKRYADGAQLDSLRVIRSPRRRLSRANVTDGDNSRYGPPAKPVAMRTVHVERCGRISQGEIELLKAAEYGLEDVYWSG